MAWTSFAIDRYHVHLIAHGTALFSGVYGFIRLFVNNDKERPTLWFYRDSETTIPANTSTSSGGSTNFYARFGQAQFRDCVDLLRNERPVFFSWDETTKGAFLSTREEPVGEAELP